MGPQPVVELLLPKFGNTLILAGASFVLAATAGIAAGVLAAARERTAIERVTMRASLVVGNMPPFWLGLVLIVVFAIALRWLPSLGMYSTRGAGGLADLLSHLVLPAVTTAAAPRAIIARMTRASGLQVLGAQYIMVARPKGPAEPAVITAHAVRVALAPILHIPRPLLEYL